MNSPHRQFAVDIVRALRDAGFEALWAGGCVRDLLLGREPQDFDVATNARPEQVREVFGVGNTLTVGASFGVIIVKGGRRRGLVEVATFRNEGPYSDGRRPDNVQFSSAREDAQRRDFTINGMFFDPVDERIHDYVGGEHDLQQRLLRAIGDARERMTEDKLRMLRAVRFAATLDFQLDPETATAVRELAPELGCVSAERITQELRKMWESEYRTRAARLLLELGLLQFVLPEVAARAASADGRETWNQILATFDELPADASLVVCLAVMLIPDCLDADCLPEQRRLAGEDAAERLGQIGRRLRLPNTEREQLAELVTNIGELAWSARRDLAWQKRTLCDARIRDRLLLEQAWARSLDNTDWEDGVTFLQQRFNEWSEVEFNPPPLLTGQDLIRLGFKPGPRFKQVLDDVRDAQLNALISTGDEAETMARAILDCPSEKD